MSCFLVSSVLLAVRTLVLCCKKKKKSTHEQKHVCNKLHLIRWTEISFCIVFFFFCPNSRSFNTTPNSPHLHAAFVQHRSCITGNSSTCLFHILFDVSSRNAGVFSSQDLFIYFLITTDLACSNDFP